MTSLSQVARKIASIKDTVLGEAMSNKRFVAGLSMLIFIVLLGVVGSLFAPCPESAIIGLRCTDAQWLPPSPHHPLGTNQRGRIYSLGLQ